MSCMNMTSAFLSSEPSTSNVSTSKDTNAFSLLQRLQQAILSGQPQMAANVASELAKMRANCSMSMKRTEVQVVNEKVTEEPIRVQVEPTTTISDLETQIYQKHRVPIRGRCVVLLETKLPSQESPVEIVDAGLENSSNGMKTDSESGTKIETAGIEWACAACTFLNEPTDSCCSICDTIRSTCSNAGASSVEPEIMVLPGPSTVLPGPSTVLPCPSTVLPGPSTAEEFPIEEVYSNYQELLDMEQTDLITNLDAFECPICMTVHHPGDGVVLKTCLHSFCRDCLRLLIESSSDAEIKCPYVENYACDKLLQDREIRALLSPESYSRYLQISMNEAESKMANTFHCKKNDCSGWCEFEKNVNVFACPVCYKNNCLACQAIHEGLNCAQYQRKIQIESENDPVARKTLKHLEKMLEKGEAMNCPTCQIIILKRTGCDAILCTMCKTEICWATKGPRWGPRGRGDTSGGCGCSFIKKCHPKCGNCH
ncbi:hypothetical protein V9T40_003946 [Parthenolecanium corni]|uniref:RanBP-type and C3HC4-type zinc finger-containing protein 1 n=1 Tax=Parthenolecanium corni TaxID=536013 RepID=A0AAN9Y4C9_9HEMI